jgi:hypothetical protein
LQTELKILHEAIMDIQLEHFGTVTREIFGGMPPEGNHKVYLCEFATVFWPEYDLGQWLRYYLLHDASICPPIETVKELVDFVPEMLGSRALRLLDSNLRRSAAEFIDLCSDFLRLFDLQLGGEYFFDQEAVAYSARELREILKPYLYRQ